MSLIPELIELQHLDPSDRIKCNLYASETIQEHAKKITDELKADVFYIRLKNFIWKKLQSNADTEGLKQAIISSLEEINSKEYIRTITLRIYERLLSTMQVSPACNQLIFPRKAHNETLSHIKEARIEWEQNILDEIKEILAESGTEFSTLRSADSNPLNDSLTKYSIQYNNNNNTSDSGANPDDADVDIENANGMLATTITLNNTNSNEGEEVGFLYDTEDFVETCLDIQPPLSLQYINNNGIIQSNQNDNQPLINNSSSLFCNSLIIGSLNSTYLYPSMLFPQLSLQHTQLGIDDQYFSSSSNITSQGGGSSVSINSRLMQQYHEEGECAIQQNSIFKARKLLQRGCPPSLRSSLWRLAMGLKLGKSTELYEDQYYLRLISEIKRIKLLTDSLFLKDIQIISDDPKFFIFEHDIKEIILAFTRDYKVKELLIYEPHSIIDYDNEKKLLPPCGVYPFLGFAYYWGPICYLYPSTKKSTMYFLGREIFCKLWSKLSIISAGESFFAYKNKFQSTTNNRIPVKNTSLSPTKLKKNTSKNSSNLFHDLSSTINSNSNDESKLLNLNDTSLILLKLFDLWLWEANSKLVNHLRSFQIEPSKIAYGWIHLGFANYLDIEQLFHLWDRVIGYQDLKILVVAAVSIFLYRSESLLKCVNENEIFKELNENSRIHIITLLQIYLFNTN